MQADIALLSGLGVVGGIAGLGLCVGYVFMNLERVKSEKGDGRWRFIDVSQEHEKCAQQIAEPAG